MQLLQAITKSRPLPRHPAQSTARHRPRSTLHSKAYRNQPRYRVHVLRAPRLSPAPGRVPETDCVTGRAASRPAKAVRRTTIAGTRSRTRQNMVRMEAIWRGLNRRDLRDPRAQSRHDRLAGLPAPYPLMRPQIRGIWNVCHPRAVRRPVRPRRRRHCLWRHQQLRHKQSRQECRVAIAAPAQHHFGGETKREGRNAMPVVSDRSHSTSLSVTREYAGQILPFEPDIG